MKNGYSIKKDFSTLLDEAAEKVTNSLVEMAGTSKKTPIDIVTEKSIS